MLRDDEQPFGKQPVARTYEGHCRRGEHADAHAGAEHPLLGASEIRIRAEYGRDERNEGQCEGRRGGKARGGLRARQALCRDRACSTRGRRR